MTRGKRSELKHLRIDMVDVEYMDSSALGILLVLLEARGSEMVSGVQAESADRKRDLEAEVDGEIRSIKGTKAV